MRGRVYSRSSMLRCRFILCAYLCLVAFLTPCLMRDSFNTISVCRDSEGELFLGTRLESNNEFTWGLFALSAGISQAAQLPVERL